MDWHRSDVKAAIEKKGFSLRRLAFALGYHPSALSRVLDIPYPEMEGYIALFLDLKPQKIWPSRYDSDGLPNRGKRRREPSAKTLERLNIIKELKSRIEKT